MRINDAASIDFPANYQCMVQSIRKKTCLCNAACRQKVLLRNPFPHFCITPFHLSIFVSVCTVCAFSLCCEGWSVFQWSVISVPGLLIPHVYIKDLRSAAPGASVLSGACAYSTCPAVDIYVWTHTLYHATQTHYTTSTNTAGPTNRSPQLSKISQLPHAWSSCPSEPCSFIMEPMWQDPALAHSTVHAHTNSALQDSAHSSICVSVLLVASQQWSCVSAGLVLPQSLSPAATHPSWSLTVNKEIQSPAAHHTWLSPLTSHYLRTWAN